MFRLIEFRLCALQPVLDDDRETTGLFGVYCRSDVHATAVARTGDQTDHGCNHGQIQMSPVGVHHVFGTHIPTGVSAVSNTRHDVQRRNERFTRARVAAVLAVFRHDFPYQRDQHGQGCFGRHDLHAIIRYVDIDSSSSCFCFVELRN